MSEPTLGTVKVIVVGNGSAGKSSVCGRLKDDGFERVYKQTVGIDWHEKRLAIRGSEVILQLHDIGGQSLSSNMIGQFVSGAGVIFLLYDVTDIQSFLDLEDWLGMIRRNVLEATSSGAKAEGRSEPRQTLIYLLANKVDLPHLRKVTQEQHDKFVKDNELSGSYSISARTGENVLKAFYAATANYFGIVLTDHELALTDKVIAVSVGAGGEEAKRAGMDAIEREDLEAEERRRKASSPGCCIVQ